MKLQAIVFDCDGVIAETERDIHRVAFNRAFKETGIPFEWDIDLYGELVKVSGGKERMKAYFAQEGWSPVEDMATYVADLHAKKRRYFTQIVKSGEISPRSGVKRLIQEACDAGIPVGIASTSHPDSIKDLVRYTMGEDFLDCFAFILGGDVVKRKKPDPAIYNLAREKLSVEASRCVVIEDSSNGLTAAKRAGMVCTVTPSFYSSGEDFSAADLIVSCLGDVGNPAESISVPGGLTQFSLVTPELLDRLVQAVNAI